MSRLRRRPGTAAYLREQKHVVLEPEQYRGKWNTFFGNDQPLHAEFGMGKGQFIAEKERARAGSELRRRRYVRRVDPQGERKGGRGRQSKRGRGGVPGNLALVLGNIAQIEHVFAAGERERNYLNSATPGRKNATLNAV